MHLSYLFAAYTVVWVVLFAYVLGLTRRSRALEREIEELRRIVNAKRNG